MITVLCVCQPDFSSPQYVRSSYSGRRLDDGDDDDDDDAEEATDDTRSTTTDEETDLVSYNLQTLTKARFVKAVVIYFA